MIHDFKKGLEKVLIQWILIDFEAILENIKIKIQDRRDRIVGKVTQ